MMYVAILLVVALTPAGLRLAVGILAIILAAAMWSAQRRDADRLVLAGQHRHDGAWDTRKATCAERRLLASSLRRTIGITCFTSLFPTFAARGARVAYRMSMLTR